MWRRNFIRGCGGTEQGEENWGLGAWGEVWSLPPSRGLWLTLCTPTHDLPYFS